MGIVLENGYEMMTTFWSDFSIADAFGTDAIRDTYSKCVKEFRNDYKYLTELVMVLNWKMFQWHRKDENGEEWKIYLELYEELDSWCMDNLKGIELQYFIKTTD